MPDNMLKKTLAVTCGDFLKEVYGERGKPEWTALTTLFPEVVTGRATLVSDLSGPLRRDGSRADWKRAQERVSGWLARYDFAGAAGEWLLGNVPETGLDGLTFAVDFSDAGKVFGGKGMEGMAMGRDGSTGDIRMGHDFVCVSLVGADCREALPVYARLGRGRRGHGEMLEEAVAAVMARTGGRGWIVGDRGMGSARLVVSLKEAGLNAVVRVRDMGRDVFVDGRAVDAAMGDAEFRDVTLAARTGSRKAQVRWRRGRCCWRGFEGRAAAGLEGNGRARSAGAAAEPCALSRNRAETARFARFRPCAQKVPGAFRRGRKHFFARICRGSERNRDKLSRKTGITPLYGGY